MLVGLYLLSMMFYHCYIDPIHSFGDYFFLIYCNELITDSSFGKLSMGVRDRLNTKNFVGIYLNNKGESSFLLLLDYRRGIKYM
jgi:hypothetical protein